jgi:hypothetical protein
MTQQHPITPLPELIEKWIQVHTTKYDLARQAAQWGADQELEACCEWLQDPDLNVDTYKLRAARRPKSPSLKEQALIHFDSYAASFETSGGDSDLIRRALEQLPDNE